METLNIKHILQMEVLTPLHVGAGAEKDWIQGADFVIDDGRIRVLNLNQVAKFIDIDNLSTALINKDSNALVKKLGGNLEKCTDKVFNCNYVGTNDIKTCIKNGLTDKPIVPGSSLKGAIRSILTNYFLDGSVTLNEQTLFGKASDGDEFMRFIKVSDAEFEHTNLVNTKIFNLRSKDEGGWKHGGNNTTTTFKPSGFNTFYEVIESKNNSIFSVSLAKEAFKNYSEKIKAFSDMKNHIINNEILFLFDIINRHTKKYLEKEKAFFQKYTADKSTKIIENIDFLINQIPKNGEYCILKMAAGSGFHSITGDWQFKDYSIDQLSYTEERWGKTRTINRGMLKNQKSAKSRKIAVLDNDQLSLMGFVKISALNAKDIQKIELEKKLRQEELEKERQDKERIEAEQKRRAEEDKKLLEQNRKKYDELIIEANQLYESKQLNEAIIKFRKAAELIPDETQHIEAIDEIENELARIQQEKQEALAALQAEAEAQKKRERQIEAGLSFLEEKFDDGRYKVTDFKGARNRIEQWLNRANHEELPADEHNVFTTSLTRIYQNITKEKDKKEWSTFEKGIWVNVIKWIGKENAKAIFDKLMQS
ncbi:MAG: hypothetical protein BGO29_14160 [Bacteroidales bacterium 36-12]|nr:MAG: hypothetical protein BGO29_14160 [Bacteroidales bacterium 36-12]